ncbi:hypothetical protein BABINDRAFT_160112 [Babjeviella inositovora NRRL Y-12698]|uniref:Formamidopyrimidine-DNA glycosylase catalytic domain-containing protein n=1 Tax=Babjeviella inositovora NRRL Y-12698 TaxID=984486 RepID=A0A1E3QW81_9ASCO|nr:uncharacterized protein BABINDRAFT_160112 [Babjeviella inositovora NRRL Y-12698]ODQ81881.1 hypothetical protein BABINDRAFT_160112 [Babjeviella inositovora NRRL Y-12698]
MPEVGEVAHAVAQLRRNTLNHKIVSLGLQEDSLLFPFLKDPENTEKILDLHDKLLNTTILSVGRHGKYFWIRLSSSDGSPETSVLVMHFGMTGWIKLNNIPSSMVFMEGGGDKLVLEQIKKEEDKIKYEAKFEKEGLFGDKEPEEVWPPKFSKLIMKLQNESTGHTIDLSFVDPRRLGRIRHLTGPKVQSNKSLVCECSPLKELGPDYLKSSYFDSSPPFVSGDPDPNNHGKPRLSLPDFQALVLSKKKPIKSLLLEQTIFSGVGNWMADEICFQARIHPNEILTSVISSDGTIHPLIEKLYETVIFVCETAVKYEAEVLQFPKDWLMPYRWGKRRKNVKVKTSDGYDVDFITIGGRTSCFVPEVQKTFKSMDMAQKRKVKEEAVLEVLEITVAGFKVEEVTLKRSKRKKN